VNGEKRKYENPHTFLEIICEIGEKYVTTARLQPCIRIFEAWTIKVHAEVTATVPINSFFHHF